MSKVLDDLIAAIEGLREGDGFTFSLISKVAKKANAALPTLLALQAALCAPEMKFNCSFCRRGCIEGYKVPSDRNGSEIGYICYSPGESCNTKPATVIIIATEGK